MAVTIASFILIKFGYREDFYRTSKMANSVGQIHQTKQFCLFFFFIEKQITLKV